MRQSLLSLCTLHKMLCRYEKCWTLARVACGQTVINMDTHSCQGCLFHLGKMHRKLMKVFLAKSALFFQWETINRDPKTIKTLLGQTHCTTKVHLQVYCVVFQLICGFEILQGWPELIRCQKYLDEHEKNTRCFCSSTFSVNGEQPHAGLFSFRTVHLQE